MKPTPNTAAPAPVPEPPPGMRAVFIREEDFHKIRLAGELFGIPDPVNHFVREIMANAVEDPDGLLDLIQTIRPPAKPPNPPRRRARKMEFSQA